MRQGPPKAGMVWKLALGAGIFAWMAASGKLNLAEVARGFSHWPLMLAIAALGYAQVAITTWRWNLLLRAQAIRMPFRRAWGLTMIGMLFNVAIPGAVGGDLIKGYYITRAAADRKSHAAASILMDRVVGMIGLLFLGAAMAAANLEVTTRSAATRSLGTLTAVGFLATMGGLYAALLAGGWLSEWRWIPGILRNVLRALGEYRRHNRVVSAALALSILNQTFSCAMYYLALRATGVEGMPMGVFFLVVPLGLVTNAIPISPGGVGVGQAAFFALFRLVAPVYAAPGTNAFTVYQVLYILVCLSGMYWYISYKHASVETGAQAAEATS